MNDIKFYITRNGLINSVFNLGLWSLLIYRAGYWVNKTGIVGKIFLIWYVFLIIKNILLWIAKIELPVSSTIGKNLNLVHAYGLVMGNKVDIGNNCTIGPWVVIGHNGKPNEQPVIGNNVYIGAHACILGGVFVGDCSIIGANAVVTKDVPPNSIVKAIFDVYQKPDSYKFLG